MGLEMKSINRKILQVGGSWAVTIDKKIAKRQGYELGEEVDVEIKKIKEVEQIGN
uniref:SpoVT-AbrB domain-containing protein n=1 Tax=viral metagenome TaxID=1070528 RepID=A0A6M3JKG0_9ZZZZ